MAASKLPKLNVVRLTKNYVTFKREDFEALKAAYLGLYNEHKNDPNVGKSVKDQWLGHYLMLSEICSKWTFPTIETKPERNKTK